MYDPNEAIENAEKKKKDVKYKSAFPEGLIKRPESRENDEQVIEKIEQ